MQSSAKYGENARFKCAQNTNGLRLPVGNDLVRSLRSGQFLKRRENADDEL